MNKKIIIFLTLPILIILISACGYTPLEFNGTWYLLSGKMTETNKPDTIFKSTKLFIENEKFTLNFEVEANFNNIIVKSETSDSGNISVNYSSKIISLNTTSHEDKLTIGNNIIKTNKNNGTFTGNNFKYDIQSSLTSGVLKLKNETIDVSEDKTTITKTIDITLTR